MKILYHLTEYLHYFLMFSYFIIPFFLSPKYLIYFPLFFVILILDWNDHDGACWITKLSTFIDGSKQYSNNFKTRETKEIRGDTAGYHLISYLGLSIKKDEESIEIKEQNIRRANYYLLLLFSIPSIISMYRVYQYYSIPFEPITFSISICYIICYLTVTHLID